MARKTTTQVSCDICSQPIDYPRSSLFVVEVSEVDPDEGGPVANLDACMTCCKEMLGKVENRKLIKDTRLRS